MAYFAGHRWCVTVADGSITWNDFSASETWRASASELTSDALQGFTPATFARQGRFEPLGARTVSTVQTEDATEFMLRSVTTWWRRWLTDRVQPGSEELHKVRFVHLLSALLLLKTIEDLGRIPWLQPGALYTASRANNLSKLIQRAAKTLNSRVLKATADLVDDADISPLVGALEASEIDFASLEIDPVGSFYEHILGTTESVTLAIQPMLPTMGMGSTLVDDVSARRRLGAFFTPRSYADVLAHQLVRPEMHIAERIEDIPSIVDLAAGSGELLCASLREVFSDADWRTPDIARAVLAEKVWAVDLNPMAVHLAALNVLRTTIRLVPTLLDSQSPLPSLDKNFITGDALSEKVLARIPEVDIAILNPPFKGKSQWSMPQTNKASALDNLKGPVNLGFAFLVVALSKVREGGGIGAVLASQLFSGVQHRQVREQVAEQLRIETMVINHGSPFPDALSYAGLLIGHRMPGVQLSHAEVITVPGGMRNGAADVGAVLFSASDNKQPGESRAVTSMVRIEQKALGNWTGGNLVKAPSGTSPRIPLGKVLKDGIHQGTVAAPEPWGVDLFLFDTKPHGVTHRMGHDVLDDRTPALRSFARPRMLQSVVPNLCEPVVPGVRVFLPGNGSSVGVRLADLERDDPVAARLASVIRASVLVTPASTLPPRAVLFADDMRHGWIRFNASKAFADAPFPQVILSRANRSAAGTSQGVNWSAWVNADGAAIPLGGIHMRPMSLEYAILISVLLNIPETVASILAAAPVRNMETREPQLSVLESQWRIPDLSSPRYDAQLAELVDAFHLYRTRVMELRADAALATQEYLNVLRLGRTLWQS